MHQNRSIGTTAENIVNPVFGQLLDILVQNLSANDVYVGETGGVTSSDGIKISPNGSYTNDKRASPVWLIASGAASDVRISCELYKPGDK